MAAACAALAIGGIVLIRAPGSAAPHGVGSEPTHSQTGFSASGTSRASFAGPGLSGEAALAQSAIQAGGTRTVLAELTFRADDVQGKTERMPVALAVVLDTSGSMTGEKIHQAQIAVRQLVERMRPDDRVALITYNHVAQVLLPLSSVSEARSTIDARIQEIYAGGGTVIPAGLELGAAQLAPAPQRFVRRVVLVSDGLDGSGRGIDLISSDLRAHASRGIYASSLGIGADYDERFLTAVADAGHGNYEFLASGAQLEPFLARELDQASATVVEQLAAAIALPTGWRLSRAFGAEVAHAGGEAQLLVGPMFRGETRRVVLELAVDAGAPGPLSAMALAVRYGTPDGEKHEIGGGELALASVPTVELADASRDLDVYARAQAVVIETRQAEAVEAWRAGDIARAQRISTANIQQLRGLQAAAPAAAPTLAPQLADYEIDADNFGRVSAGSEEGRAWGLRSNAARRERVRR